MHSLIPRKTSVLSLPFHFSISHLPCPALPNAQNHWGKLMKLPRNRTRNHLTIIHKSRGNWHSLDEIQNPKPKPKPNESPESAPRRDATMISILFARYCRTAKPIQQLPRHWRRCDSQRGLGSLSLSTAAPSLSHSSAPPTLSPCSACNVAQLIVA